MALTLTIENFAQLPDGGPLFYRASGGRGFDLGRDTYLDWTLPDPNMFVSGKHCEVRYRDGGYWLYDISLNGTYLNGAEHRLLEPYRLRHGDRLCIGQYIIAVTLDEDADGPQAAAPAGRVAQGLGAPDPVAPENIWDFDGEVPAPIDPRELRPIKPRAVAADFLDWAIEAPTPSRNAPNRAEAASPWPMEPDSDWLPAPPPAAPAPLPPAVPRPERPAWDLGEPSPQAPGPAGWAPRSSEPVDVSASFMAAPLADAMTAPAATPAAPVAPRPDRPGRDPGAPTQSAARSAREGAVATGPANTTPAADFVARFAAAAGLPKESIGPRDAGELAETLGTVMGIVVAEMWQLLEARRETKRMVRCSDPTMTKAENNNPLKFAPTPQDALRQMLGPPSRAYLAAGPALQQGFADLARHQIDTIAAMQGAIRLLIEDLDPREIERTHGSDRGLAGMLGGRKTKLWDIYVERWRTKARSHDDGLFGAYMDYFSKCYDRNVAERT